MRHKYQVGVEWATDGGPRAVAAAAVVKAKEGRRKRPAERESATVLAKSVSHVGLTSVAAALCS